jgi:hypothetical protein
MNVAEDVPDRLSIAEFADLLAVALEVGRLSVSGAGSFIAIDFVVIELIWVLAVLKDVEPKTAGLVLFRMGCVVLDHGEELVSHLGLDVDLDHEDYHRGLLELAGGRMPGTSLES